MPRDARAYLRDIAEACEAIGHAVAGVDLEVYKASRFVRSSVEREFITIGEAVAALSRTAPIMFDDITQARRIVAFRDHRTRRGAAA